MTQIELTIDGMTCGHCVQGVRKTLEGLTGVGASQVTLGAAQVQYDPTLTSPTLIARALDDHGFPTTPRRP